MPHIHEKIDWCAGVYIVYNNKVLIRKHDKYGIWIHVGGHVELDEDPVQTAIKECKEEVGLDIKIHGIDEVLQSKDERDSKSKELVVPAHMNIHWVTDTHQHLDPIYYATSDSNEVTPENPDDQWAWLTKEEVEHHPDMSEKIKHYALGALCTLGTK